jgi:hypothetical protein
LILFKGASIGGCGVVMLKIPVAKTMFLQLMLAEPIWNPVAVRITPETIVDVKSVDEIPTASG